MTSITNDLASDDSDTISVGTVLDGRYRIESVLGAGAMGCVYRAEHTGIGRMVALKVLRSELGGSRDAARRFKREALASGRLDHPNIVGVSDFGVLDDGSCFLVMQALEGESLGDRIDRDGPFPWPDAVEIMRGMLRGLAHAHQRGVVHRDIKPDNIFLAIEEGQQIVKLLDFGIAKLVAGTTDDPASTRAGMTMGTPVYLSPEQAVGGEITPGTDLYSATVVLFEMLTGHTPFEAAEPLTIMLSHVSKTPPLLAEVAPQLDLPPYLQTVISRGLEKIIGDRVASATEYLALLDEMHFAAPAPGPMSAVHWAESSSGEAIAFPSQMASSQALPVATLQSQPLVSVTLDGAASAERPHRPMSFADASEPIPGKWLVRAGAGLGATVVLAIVAAIATGGGSPESPAPKSSDGSAAVAAPSPSPRPPEKAQPPPVPVEPAPLASPPPDGDEDRVVRLKALLQELKSGKTCALRRAAIPKLVELGDPGAIPALKAARYRMRGGLLGLGQSNSNGCLKADADAAIKALAAKP